MSSDHRPEHQGESEAPTSSEVRSALQGLQPADHQRLMGSAKFYCRARLRGGVVEPGDLVNEAVARTLSGDRKWNRADCPSIVTHLTGVMRSVSSHIVEQWSTQKTRPLPTEESEQPSHDPSQRDAAAEELEELMSLFDGDQEALQILELRGLGFSASEIREELGMNDTEYDTVTKRVRRRLANHMKGGK